MATTKITDLTAYTDPVNTDVLPIVDVTSDVTKKVSIANVMKNASLGSAAAPGIAFDGDPNTGIYSPGADQVAISTGGSGRLFVDASGRVGMGAAEGTYAASLTTSGNNGFLIRTGTSSAVQIYAGNTAGEAALGTLTSDPLNLITGGNSRIRITSAGLVGVGTSSPSSLLHLSVATAASDGTKGVRITNPAGTAAMFECGSSNDSYIGTTSGSDFSIRTNNTSRIYVTNGGNVGIGTSSPSRNLDVAAGQANVGITSNTTSAGNEPTLVFTHAGNNAYVIKGGNNLQFASDSGANVRMTLTTAGLLGIGTQSPQEELHIVAASQPYIQVQSTGGTAGSAYYGYNSSTGSASIESTGSIRFAIPGSEAARIDTSGRLLVGTSTALTNIYEQATSYTPNVQFASASQSYNAGLSLINYSGLGYPATLTLGQSGSNTLNTNALVGSGNCVGSINFVVNDGTNFRSGATVQAFVDASSGSGDVPTRLVFSTTADGASSPTERMRIRNNGTVMIGTTSVPSPGGPTTSTFVASTSANDGSWTGIFQSTGASSNRGVVVSYSGASPNDGFNEPFFFQDSTTPRFYVTSNGGVKNYSANNANLSDRNVKKDITPAAGTWDCIKEWEIVNYRYQDQPDDADLNLGVIAQQVAESCPEVVTVFEKAKDDQPEKLGVKEQQMYWMAIKALQEAQVRIEQLEAKVAALEAA